ncbi:TIGR02587 family membrane protein [soil metagenome]
MPSTEIDATTPGDGMRGIAGGFVLGVPLVYTQEVWFHGGNLSPVGILGLLAASFLLNLALSTAVGFNSGRTKRPLEDAIVGFGLSFLLAAFLLILLRRVDLEMGWGPRLVIIALSAVPISLGFALGNSLAPKEGGELEEKAGGGFGDLLAAAGGAVILVLNIAPTEEPLLLAAELGSFRLISLVLVALAITYLMVFYAEFGGKHVRRKSEGPIHTPLVETMLAYLVALVVAAGLLWSFGEIPSIDGATLAKSVVLAFPASLGAALGRILV